MRTKVVAAVAAVLVAGGISAIAVAVTSQYHAPSPSAVAAGTTGPLAATAGTGKKQSPTPQGSRTRSAPSTTTPTQTPTVVGPVLDRSVPVAIAIPAIHVQSQIFDVGLNPDGTIEVPPLNGSPLTNEAAWYEYSPTPGQLGPSIIEGHIDSATDGPSVFFDLGALAPGDQIDVSRADGTVAVFTISGVRQYPKAAFPAATVYANADFAALRLITCGGSFDYTTHHYLNNTVVFASLTSSHPAS